MKNWLVTFESKIDVEVTAETEKEARQKARGQLDPDVDWDCLDIYEIEENS